MDIKYLMVRAMNSNDNDFKIFFENSVVAVGWSEINFTEYSSEKLEEITEKVKECYYSATNILPQVCGRKLNEVRRFISINPGDYIVIPFYNSIRLAIAEDRVIYSNAAYESDLANQRKVSYCFSGNQLKTIPRDVLSEALQRRLRVRGSTVSDLYEFKDEIENLFTKDGYTWTSAFEEKETELKELLKEKLFKKIQSGKTNLKTGGLGLENLVQELFECEGYTSEVLPKNKFYGDGDADISAVKFDKFQEIKILIQVKHHIGFTDDWGLKQLDEIRKGSEYKDHKFVLITSANLSDDVRKYAEELNIAAIDGNELSEWIIENLFKLKADTKIKLGISSIPQFNSFI